jgi:hypothetical protein
LDEETLRLVMVLAYLLHLIYIRFSFLNGVTKVEKQSIYINKKYTKCKA